MWNLRRAPSRRWIPRTSLRVPVVKLAAGYLWLIVKRHNWRRWRRRIGRGHELLIAACTFRSVRSRTRRSASPLAVFTEVFVPATRRSRLPRGQRGKRQTSLAIRKCHACRPDCGGNIGPASRGLPRRCGRHSVILAVKMPRLRGPALLAPTRDGTNRGDAGWRGEGRGGRMRERKREHDRVPPFVTSVATQVSLRPPSFAVALPGRQCSPPFFPRGLQIACQLNHNRDSGSRDNLASGYRGVSSPRPEPKASAPLCRYRVHVNPD